MRREPENFCDTVTFPLKFPRNIRVLSSLIAMVLERCRTKLLVTWLLRRWYSFFVMVSKGSFDFVSVIRVLVKEAGSKPLERDWLLSSRSQLQHCIFHRGFCFQLSFCLLRGSYATRNHLVFSWWCPSQTIAVHKACLVYESRLEKMQRFLAYHLFWQISYIPKTFI